MRRVESKGSAKAFSMDRDEALRLLRDAASQALRTFPEAVEILLFGSVARGTHTGLSDLDIAVVLKDTPASDDPIERARPYQDFFFRRFRVGTDVIAFREGERERMRPLLEGSLVLARREGGK